jgi:hypothetical protein
MLRLDGGEHGVDPAGLALTLVLDGRHTIEHFMGEVSGRLLCTGYEQGGNE